MFKPNANPQYGNVGEPKEKSLTPFPFIKLPPEIRNRVYELALINPDVIETRGSYSCQHGIDNHRVWGPQLFYSSYRQRFSSYATTKRTIAALKLVSHRVSQEAAAVFFRKTVFRFLHLSKFRCFLSTISAIERQLLTEVHLPDDILGGTVKDVDLLRKCTGLRTLEIFHPGHCGDRRSVHLCTLYAALTTSKESTVKAFCRLRGLHEFSIQSECSCPDFSRECRNKTVEVEARIRREITKPRSQASLRAQIVRDTPELWKELKAEKQGKKANSKPATPQTQVL